MSDQILSSDKERKRPNVCSESLLYLKSMITQNVTSNNRTEYKFVSSLQNDESDEIEMKRRKKSEIFPNRNVLIEYLTKPDLKQLSNRQIISSKLFKEHDETQNLQQSIIPSASKRIVIPRNLINEKEQMNDEKYIDIQQIKINDNPVLLQSNTRIVIANDEQHSSELSMTSNDKQSTMISRLPLSPSMRLFNSSISSLLSFSVNHKPIDNSFSLRQYPQFESVQESQSSIPSELLDCCESNEEEEEEPTSIKNNSDYSDSFYTSVLLRETMINISKRLTNMASLPIVDTHCHFDLIFDRLYIKHNNLKRYFDDYKDFYPSDLSFELAIQVFWRPRHLTKKNWENWYSKYLNDERVYGSCGIHPHWSSAWTETSIENIERCLKHPKVVAIGEIGLDFGPKNTCNIDQQCRVFEEQLKLAVKWLKPIVIHSRDAYQQTFHIMKQYLEPNHKIHLHCFVGTIDDVHLFTSYFNEIKFGFTPIISRGNFLHTVIQQLDLTQILSETDSPYFVPEELSNLSRCAHPGMVYSVIEIVAQIRQLSISNVAGQLRENAYHIYGV